MIELLPAIDLRNGKCVRLQQGDYNRETAYNEDPVAQARTFEDAGARWLHVVDLDGAKDGAQYNYRVLRRIRAATALHIEVGGGIRTEQTVRNLLDLGINRVIIGSQALDDFPWFQQLVRSLPGRIVLGMDARQGKLATHGWLQDSGTDALAMAEATRDLPLDAIVFTDIERDGMLTGPSIDGTRQIAEATTVPVIASGGVKSIDDIKALVQLPIAGIITGRALYEGTLSLSEALTVVRGK